MFFLPQQWMLSNWGIRRVRLITEDHLIVSAPFRDVHISIHFELCMQRDLKLHLYSRTNSECAGSATVPDTTQLPVEHHTISLLTTVKPPEDPIPLDVPDGSCGGGAQTTTLHTKQGNTLSSASVYIAVN